MEDKDWLLIHGGYFELENGYTVEPDLALFSTPGCKEQSRFPQVVFEIGISRSLEQLKEYGKNYIRYSKW